MKEIKTAIKNYFTNFANYRGITGKTEYFFCVCFGLSVLSLAELVMKMVGFGSTAFFVVDTILLIPLLTLCARRLNDANKNWIFAFAIMLPSPFSLILIAYLLVIKGKKVEHFSQTFVNATYAMLVLYGILKVAGNMFIPVA
ncbi:MAG: DUF805 domain-containing protein [Oscillospiraceae bacterium]|nr:DUF805 domain-containing protein [Oscillospiraceae bacterium]